MPLNEQTGNMYGFVTHTWNTVKGKCPHDCVYCYMKRFPQKELRFADSELKTDLGEGNVIFVGSSCDMFADLVPDKYIIQTLEHCRKFKNRYLFQSKNPGRFAEFETLFPKKTTLLTTIESTFPYMIKYSGGLMFFRRKSVMQELATLFPVMITIEPILDFDVDTMVTWITDIKPMQVNIGADSGNNKLPEPDMIKVKSLIKRIEPFTKVFLKSNLDRLINKGF